MVHAKKLGVALERSLLILLLMVLWAPSASKAQRSNLQPPQNTQVKLSSAFLQGRAYMQNASAQQMSPAKSRAGATLQNPAAPVYDVVALRVSFQADTSRFTTGDGTFSGALFDTLSSNVDPLPHDAAYFDAHLQFLENYVSRVSDGKTELRTHLIPEVVKVSQEMAAYSPTGLDANSDAEIAKLANLVDEAWSLASQVSSFDMSGFNPATTALILFHAGVGRDIELVGTTLDKTPQDLPTIFFNEASLERLLPGANTSFNGFPVDHTILMPRTESRLGFDFIQDVPFLIDFSINGLLAASFFNYLGVPDLFNTSTGESAIGPFGLMDPLGLFAFNGLFPPEPSGWTKHFLGWADPVDITLDQTISLSAASTPAINEQAHIAISASEYFLVENRNRDVDNDGLTLTIYRDGQTFTQVVQNGEEDFNSINIDGFSGGVVVDVDDYDWAMPGGVDADGNDLNGGILIWHIDERILANGLTENRVNVDPVQRGVDLEEADGAQDIGFPSDNIFGPQAFLGSPFDFFYEGNPIVVITGTGEEIGLYENRFGPATYPNSNSNANGPSYVELSNFTAPGPVMSFNYARDASAVHTPIEGFSEPASSLVPLGSFITAFPNTDAGLIYQANRGEIAINARNAANPSFLRSNLVKSPIVLPDGRIAALGTSDIQSEAHVLILENGELTSIPLDVNVHFLPSQRNHLLYDNQQNRLVAVIEGTDGGASIVQVDLTPGNGFAVSNLSGFGASASIAISDRGEVIVLGSSGVACPSCGKQWSYSTEISDVPGQLVMGRDAEGLTGAFTHLSEERLIILHDDESTSEIPLRRYNKPGEAATLSRFPLLVDLDGDDVLEVMLTYGSRLFAFKKGGAMAAGFPIEMPAEVTTQPLIGSFTGGSGLTAILGSSDGYVYAYGLSENAETVPGFPLAVGASITATPLLKDNALYAVDASGVVSAWQMEGLDSIVWGEHFGSQNHTSFVVANAGGGNDGASAEALLPATENYNWPNPIREGRTFFRLTPSSDARITITIIDTAGAMVDKIVRENVKGNTSTDVLWQTDASSGLYYARVEAVTADGTSETKLIKMAIVR